jgi:hypothetical protein
MGIVAQDELFEGGRCELILSTAVGEALPSHADGRVDADEQEEWPAEQCVDYLVVPDVGCHPPLFPSQGDKVQ